MLNPYPQCVRKFLNDPPCKYAGGTQGNMQSEVQ